MSYFKINYNGRELSLFQTIKDNSEPGDTEKSYLCEVSLEMFEGIYGGGLSIVGKGIEKTESKAIESAIDDFTSGLDEILDYFSEFYTSEVKIKRVKNV